MSFVTIGLLLDLFGFLFLGADLIRIQKQTRTRAEARMTSFQEFVSSNDAFQSYADSLSKNADWRPHDYDEGRMVPYDGFDSTRAAQDFQEAVDLSRTNRDDLAALAKCLDEIYYEDKSSAAGSLKFSIVGMCLIIAGFASQLIGQIWTI